MPSTAKAVAIVALSACIGCAIAAIPASERAALVSFYESTGGPQWTIRDGWCDSSVDPCSWYGVTCTADSAHVNGLFLARNNLVGSIPESIGALASMTGMDVGVNRLSGRLPTAFGTLKDLYAVSVRENELSGPLPFGSLRKMQFAHLDFNHFEGTLDPFRGCPGLKVLGLTDNSLSGSIPEAFGAMADLETLFLGGNKLTGTVPQLGSSKLVAVDLGRNALSGLVPAKNVLMSNPGLVEFLTFGNSFTGPLSGQVSRHDSVVVLDAHDNKISGDVPSVLANGMSALQMLRLQHNSFTGFVPQEFRTTTVASVDLSGNPLFCPVPLMAGKAECVWWAMERMVPDRCPTTGGVAVDIYGHDFVPGQENVKCAFGGIARVPATVMSSTRVRCTVPTAAAPGTVAVALEYAGQRIVNSTVIFTYYEAKTANPARDAKPVEVLLIGEAKCPDMASIEGIFLPILQSLGTGVVDVKLGWIAKANAQYPTGFWSLHGQTEVIGNALTSCAAKKYGIVGALAFAECMNANITRIPSNAAACANALGLDSAALHSCALGDEGMSLVSDGVVLADKYGAVWSPTVWIDGKLYCLWHSAPCKASSEADFLRAVCDAYTGPRPSACPK